MADINERINIETGSAVTDLDKLKGATKDADTALDDLKDTAADTDKASVDIPVDVPGAEKAAADLNKIDDAGRKAGSGVKVGVNDMTDTLGPLGDISGKAGEVGQAFEGLGGFAEAAAGKLGASEETLGKISGALGPLAIGLGVATAAWGLYTASQEEAKKKAEELKKSIEEVLEAKAKGDAAAAADAFIEKFGPLVKQIQDLTGLDVPDIVASLTGETGPGTGRLDAVNQALIAIGTDGAETLRQKARDLQGDWKQANIDFEATTKLKDEVTAAFTEMGDAAETFATRAEDTANRYEYARIRMAGAGTAAPGQSSQPGAPFDPNVPIGGWANPYAAAAFGAGVVVNNFPPANTPIAVDQASSRYRQINGPQ